MMLPRIVLFSCNIGFIIAVSIVYHFLESENEKMASFSLNLGAAFRCIHPANK
jgi:hypothetical protein